MKRTFFYASLEQQATDMDVEVKEFSTWFELVRYFNQRVPKIDFNSVYLGSIYSGDKDDYPSFLITRSISELSEFVENSAGYKRDMLVLECETYEDAFRQACDLAETSELGLNSFE